MSRTGDAARALLVEGVSVIPTQGKRSVGAWKPYQSQLATPEQVGDWFDGDADVGVAAVCGGVSSNLTMFELEGRASKLYPLLQVKAAELGYDELWQRVDNGWREASPSGGTHWFVRSTKVDRNLKLAADESGNVLAETRGSGGYVIVAPTSGGHHETGKPWVRLAGGPASIPRVTEQELEVLYRLFRFFDRCPEKAAPKENAPRRAPVSGDRPGDLYAAANTWEDILLPLGWKQDSSDSQEDYWTRPGKERGVSASTRADGNLYVFSTSTDLPHETPLSKFHVYAHYHHGGNYGEAAKSLAGSGYGNPLPEIDFHNHKQDSTPVAKVGQSLEVPRRFVVLTPANKVRIEKAEWLYEDLLPKGVISLLTGVAGEGKSTLALHIAARLTRGELPGEHLGRPMKVAITALEDMKSIQVARLKASGADMNLVSFLEMGIDYGNGPMDDSLIFPRDLHLVQGALEQEGVGLWIIDPITGAIPGDSHRRDDVRKALDPLHLLAQELNIGVLGVAHFNKGGGKSRDKISGSHAFRDIARSHIPLVADPETGKRVFTLEKCNYSTRVGDSYQFDITSHDIHTADNTIMSVGAVANLVPSNSSVDEIINRNVDQGTDDTSDALSFIMDHLEGKGGEVPSKEVLKAARAVGFNDNEIKNARKRAKNPTISSRKASFGGGWVWAINTPEMEFHPLEEVTNTPKADTFDNSAPVQRKAGTSPAKVSKESSPTKPDTFDTFEGNDTLVKTFADAEKYQDCTHCLTPKKHKDLSNGLCAKCSKAGAA